MTHSVVDTGNDIGRDGAFHLAPGLTFMRQLIAIDLSGSDAHCVGLRFVLIPWLFVQANRIDDCGTGTLAHSMARCPHLSTVSLAG